MGSSDTVSLALISLTLFAILHSSQAQNSRQDYLTGHNSARSAVGVVPITWDADLAAFAQDYADQRAGDCSLMHSGGGEYGENIAIGSGDFTGAAAVGSWVGEKSNYDYSSNSCVGGECRHYTQVVWRNSVRLGCARVQCNNGSWFITCNYDPPGNYVGQRPFSIYLALVCLPDEPEPEPEPKPDSPQEYLNAHNSARAAVGVGPMTWDANVAAYAQNYGNQRAECALKHSIVNTKKYGESIAKGTGDFSGAAAVGLWVGEKPDYNYNSNSCAPGKVCSHYTQVVWRNTVRLGCARVQCDTGWWFVICNYDPPGNYIGERPY